MEQLRQEVAERRKCFVSEYVAAHIDMNDPFRSTGHAYIQLTKEEPHLFKIFILHRRDGIASPDEIFTQQERVYQIFMKNILEGNHEQ